MIAGSPPSRPADPAGRVHPEKEIPAAQKVSGSVAEALKVDLPVNVPDAEHFEGIHKAFSSLLYLGV